MIAQRISNIPYPKGSLIYARVSPYGEFGYLHMRPLIVISHQTQMFDTVTCITCGSRDRPGIEISIYNHYIRKYIGDNQYSVAMPWTITTIPIGKIAEFHGVIDPYIMKAIDDAIQYHIGLSDKIPPYMADIHKEYFEPRYNLGTIDNTQLKDPHLLTSPIETTRNFPKYTPARDVGVKYGNSKRTTEEDNNNQRTNSQQSQQPVVQHNTTNQSDCIKKTFTKRILKLIASLNDKDKISYLGRLYPIGTPIKDPNGKVIAKNGTIIAALEQEEHLLDGKKLVGLKNRLLGNPTNYRFLSDYERIIIALYTTPRALGINADVFYKEAKSILKKYNVSFNDGRRWRGFANYNELVAIL